MLSSTIDRGITYGEKGQYDQAIDDFNKALEIRAQRVLVPTIDRGIAYYFKNEYDKSLKRTLKGHKIWAVKFLLNFLKIFATLWEEKIEERAKRFS